MPRLPLTPRLLFVLVLAASAAAGCATAEQFVDDAMRGATAGGADGRSLVASEATWSTEVNPSGYSTGRRLAYDCPPNPSQTVPSDAQIWGSNPYTTESALCLSAVHAGAIAFDRGGRVVIEVRGNHDRYPASTRYGVTSTEYGPWSSSYVVVAD